jgi:hypothetical protein
LTVTVGSPNGDSSIGSSTDIRQPTAKELDGPCLSMIGSDPVQPVAHSRPVRHVAEYSGILKYHRKPTD